MTCDIISVEKGRIRALSNMGHRFKAVRNSPEHQAIVMDRLNQLTPRELEICLLHFVEGRPQELIAEWLGIALRVVQRHVTRAVLKVPDLRPLRTKSLQDVRRPKIFLMSQLDAGERGPFNVDEI